MDNLTNQQVANVGQTVVTTQPSASTQVVNNSAVAPNNQVLFSQEQLNGIIQGRVNPLNQRISDLNSELKTAKQLAQGYLNELNTYKQKEIVANAGVPAQFADFVTFEANKLAVNGKSFADAVKEYTEKNSGLWGATNVAAQSGSAGVIPPTAQPAQVTAPVSATSTTTQVVNSVLSGATAPNASGVEAAVDALLRRKGIRK